MRGTGDEVVGCAWVASEVRGALIVRSEVCDKIKIARGGPTHQKFSWISSSAAASQMVGPITSSSSISVDMSCVSRGARGWVVSPLFVHGFDKRFLLELTTSCIPEEIWWRRAGQTNRHALRGAHFRCAR